MITIPFVTCRLPWDQGSCVGFSAALGSYRTVDPRSGASVSQLNTTLLNQQTIQDVMRWGVDEIDEQTLRELAVR